MFTTQWVELCQGHSNLGVTAVADFTCGFQSAIVVDCAISVVATIGYEEVYTVLHMPKIPFIVVPSTVYDHEVI